MSKRFCQVILISFAALLLVGFAALDAARPAGRRAAKIGGFDPVNYFGIAHSLLFDHDFNLSNEFLHLKPDGEVWARRQPATGLPGSPWGIGYSVLAIPFLAVGVAVDAAVGNPPDGFSNYAIYFFCLTNIVLTGLGMFALFTFLRRVALEWEMRESQANAAALLLAFATFFGTNVGYYAFSQLAHAAVFLFVSLFLNLWWRIRDSERPAVWFGLGLLGGFLSIIRWQDLLFIGGPLLYDVLQRVPSRRGLTSTGSRWLRSRALFMLAVAICWAPQIFEWKIIYDKYLTVPQGPGFLSLPPGYMLQVLFSSRNGFFIWTPLALLGTAGLVYAAFLRGNAITPWLAVFGLELAAAGSMKTWHGFDSFSSRYMNSTCPLIALGVLALLAAPTLQRRVVTVAVVGCCLFSTLFALEFGLHLVPISDRLTFSELVTDRLAIPRLRRQKLAVNQARALLAAGNLSTATALLRRADAEGPAREVLGALKDVCKAAGDIACASESGRQEQGLMDSRLW
jgi:hypothetical protein